jgi:hypothetical protein
MFAEELQSNGSDLLAEVNAEDFEVFEFGKDFKRSICNGLFHVVGTKTFEFFGVFKEGNQGGFIDVFAEGNVDRCEIFAGFTQFNDDSIGDWDRGEDEGLDVGSKVSNFIDEFVGDVCLVAEVEVF